MGVHSKLVFRSYQRELPILSSLDSSSVSNSSSHQSDEKGRRVPRQDPHETRPTQAIHSEYVICGTYLSKTYARSHNPRATFCTAPADLRSALNTQLQHDVPLGLIRRVKVKMTTFI